MKDWIPFLQTLVWPVFLGILLVVFRRAAFEVLASIVERIKGGAEMSVGPSGLTLGVAPVLKTDETLGKEISEQKQENVLTDFTGAIYMVHRARFARMVPEGKDYEITVRVFTGSAELEDRIERVEYHLHRSYRNRIRESSDKSKNFELILYAWGQFNLKALVYIKGESKPLLLWRFLDFS